MRSCNPVMCAANRVSAERRKKEPRKRSENIVFTCLHLPNQVLVAAAVVLKSKVEIQLLIGQNAA